jgi:hypothetical protein
MAMPAVRNSNADHLSRMKPILARRAILWHGGFVRLLLRSLVFTAAIAAGGCFQSTTVITVNGDGSGTIDEQVLFSGAALAQMRGLASLGGGKAFDPISEDQARQAASALGPTVRYVSSKPIATGEGLGRTIVYAFTDINQLHLNEQPPAPGGVTIRSRQLNTAENNIRFTLAPQADGRLVLHILLPQSAPPPRARRGSPPPPPSSEDLATLKDTFAGARLSIAVKPAGSIVRTSSPWVDKDRVLVIDLDFDQMAADPAVLARLRGVTSVDDARSALSGVPGVKLPATSEVTIEFIPAK